MPDYCVLRCLFKDYLLCILNDKRDESFAKKAILKYFYFYFVFFIEGY